MDEVYGGLEYFFLMDVRALNLNRWHFLSLPPFLGRLPQSSACSCLLELVAWLSLLITYFFLLIMVLHSFVSHACIIRILGTGSEKLKIQIPNLPTP